MATTISLTDQSTDEKEKIDSSNCNSSCSNNEKRGASASLMLLENSDTSSTSAFSSDNLRENKIAILRNVQEAGNNICWNDMEKHVSGLKKVSFINKRENK